MIHSELQATSEWMVELNFWGYWWIEEKPRIHSKEIDPLWTSSHQWMLEQISGDIGELKKHLEFTQYQLGEELSTIRLKHAIYREWTFRLR